MVARGRLQIAVRVRRVVAELIFLLLCNRPGTDGATPRAPRSIKTLYKPVRGSGRGALQTSQKLRACVDSKVAWYGWQQRGRVRRAAAELSWGIRVHSRVSCGRIYSRSRFL